MKTFVRTVIITLFCPIIFIGCGRKGALERPPASVMESSQEEFVSKNKADKAFILDRLIK
ncbi:hypothetical protein X471_00904 [Bartonella bacilliformis str. Heidi Mejia]|uniref:Lipoprotein n=2 Tax=Bartonella bacilliformis TaxID=774 RepID=A0ABN0IHG9_BARBA|nr:hypothetical protein [Bartonella bacilliformis]ABM44629.1 putative lipoprotein [Bartonella bacilliformis KC583]AMG85289.1 hypothetical protein AL467_00435 [Bartonella bacilliformis]EKS45951.1 putative lipoprotein [Bartonella bacilliformis INS]EYS88810.1 hypothetical protein X472_00897 [Bartonella bacilliformis San Pedro600-02]EYS90772.1 hypothetical protein X471_00904 [Bartonella bacilliformis str. Heidi Mejia]